MPPPLYYARLLDAMPLRFHATPRRLSFSLLYAATLQPFSLLLFAMLRHDAVAR